MSSESIGPRETWATRVGLILAMAGYAIGLGNFLRFPGRVALYGGGAFLIPYFIAMLLLGFPLVWLEWAIGRYGGQYRAHWLAPMMYLITRNKFSKRSAELVAGLFGGLVLCIAILINAYYTNIIGWIAFWAGMSISGRITEVTEVKHSVAYLLELIGNPAYNLIPWIVSLIVLALIVMPGISKGLEKAAKVMTPTFLLLAIGLLVTSFIWRTPVRPEWDSIKGFLWVWTPRFEKLIEPATWFEGAGQIFYSLGPGIAGTIPTYASYIRREDDIALGALTTSALNEFAEVVCGGTIAFSLGYAFGGELPIGMVYVDGRSPFFLAMAVYPAFFGRLGAAGAVLGVIWYFLLWLAGVTSAVSVVNVISEIMQGYGWSRVRSSVLAIVLHLSLGLPIVIEGAITKTYEWGPTTVYLDFTDFIIGSFLLVVVALLEVVFAGAFLWPKGYEEVNRGGLIKVPKWLWRYVLSIMAPIYLVVIIFWLPYSARPGAIIYQTLEPLAWLGPTLAGLSATFTIVLFAIGFMIGYKLARKYEMAEE